MIRAVLFDFFGTLVPCSPPGGKEPFRRTHALLTDYGIRMTYDAFVSLWNDTAASLDRVSGKTGTEYALHQVAEAFVTLAARRPMPSHFALRLERSYLEDSGALGPLRQAAGAAELLRRLGERVWLGIVSNTHHAPTVHTQIRWMGFAPYLRTVVTSIEHGSPKPNPSIYAAALDRLGVGASETLFVGDGYVPDYLGPRSAGLRALLLDPARSTPAPREHVIRSLRQVWEVVRRESGR